MRKLSITLPDDIDAYVGRRVAEGDYASADDFVQALIRKDQEGQRLTVDELRQRLEQAEASGFSERTFAEVTEEARRRARVRGLMR